MNRTPLSPEARELASDPEILRMARIMAAVAARRYRAPLDAMKSAAMLGVCQAAGSFDPRRGLTFRTFAAHRVAGQMADEARICSGTRRRTPRARTVSLDEPIAAGRGGEPLTARDLVESGEGPVGEFVEYHDLVEALTRRLPTRVKRAVRARLTDARCPTGAATGKLLGVGATRASDLLSLGFEQIREHPGVARR